MLVGLVFLLSLIGALYGQQPAPLSIANCKTNMTEVDPKDTSKTICKSCIDGYVASDTKRSCVNCNPNCKTCRDFPETCASCVTGYYLDNKDFNCGRCVKDCLECSDKNSCSKCERGFYFSNPTVGCALCNITNCESCDANGQCAQCKSGFAKIHDETTKKVSCAEQDLGFYVLYGIGVIVLIYIMGALIWVICFCCAKKVVIYTDDSIEIQPATVVFEEEGHL